MSNTTWAIASEKGSSGWDPAHLGTTSESSREAPNRGRAGYGIEMRKFEVRRPPRRAKVVLGVGSTVLFLVGLFVGLLAMELTMGVLLFALGTMLFAVRGYMETGDKVLAGVLIFVASVAIGIDAVV